MSLCVQSPCQVRILRILRGTAFLISVAPSSGKKQQKATTRRVDSKSMIAKKGKQNEKKKTKPKKVKKDKDIGKVMK